MKIYHVLIVLLAIGCQAELKLDEEVTSKPEDIGEISTSPKITDSSPKIPEAKKSSRESENFISVLEEIPGRDSNAYKLTISEKNGNKQFSKILDVRPRASMINYCNDMYTVVGFSCGGPCYSQVFVFTDESRPNEQFGFAKRVGGYPNLITHIKDETFEKLWVHNFDTGKEMLVENPDINPWMYGQMDTVYVQGNQLKIAYSTEGGQTKKKSISLKPILNE